MLQQQIVILVERTGGRVLDRQNPVGRRTLLDRGVVRSYLGDTLAARSDLEQYLVLADSFEVSDPARRAVVERLLEDLTPARTAAR